MGRSRSLRWVAGAGLVLLLGIAAGSFDAVAAPNDRDTEIAARQAFAAARYDEAIELFAKLYAESLNPIYLRNIGRCHQKKREPDKAIDAFHDYLAKGKGISSAERKEIQGYIREMQQLRDDEAKRATAQALPAPPPPPAQPPSPPAQPMYATAPPPPPPGAMVDPTQPQPPPPYALGAPPPADGTQMTIATQPEGTPAPRPFYKRWWFWTAIGVVAVGTLVTVVAVSGGGTTKPDCPFSATCQ
jgi:hypothetical protein